MVVSVETSSFARSEHGKGPGRNYDAALCIRLLLSCGTQPGSDADRRLLLMLLVIPDPAVQTNVERWV